MKLAALFYVLFKLRLLSPVGISRLVAAVCRYGVNVMALLRIAEGTYGDRTAITDDGGTLTYRQLLTESERACAYALLRLNRP